MKYSLKKRSKLIKNNIGIPRHNICGIGTMNYKDDLLATLKQITTMSMSLLEHHTRCVR
jgi:hypothetical protein